ncbi:MAG TPA: peptide deformylase [Candidatus Dormibacteraeota bacterium]|nr:peptide deformylase [Candidatus Dormibacteraeota bacterium]
MPYLRRIITEGHPTLRKVAKKVKPEEVGDPLFQQLIDDMFLTMYRAPGIGLAAPQVNVSKRIFTIDLRDGDPAHGPFVVINPKIEFAEEEIESPDGCLSVPGYAGISPRYGHLAVCGLDRRGNKTRLEGTGLFAVCLQHEIDHLDGILYIDKARDVRPIETGEEEGEAAERETPDEAAGSTSRRAGA